MTDNGRFKFLSVLAFLVVQLGCATPQRGVASVEFASIAEDPETLVKAELSATEAVDGSVLIAQVKLPAGAKAAFIEGDFDGIKIPFYHAPTRGETAGEKIYEAIIGVPHSYRTGPAHMIVKYGEIEETARTLNVGFKVLESDYKLEHLKVEGSYVNPSPKTMKRIKREQQEVKKIYARVTKKKYWKGPFKLPVDADFTSPYGTKRMYNGEQRNFHSGIDLRAQIGTPINAPAPGIVVLAKNLYFTGGTILIDHGYGVMTLYAHMSRIKVKKGQFVGQGKLLGLAGATGRVSGPHLHWSTIVHNVKVNPVEFLKAVK